LSAPHPVDQGDPVAPADSAANDLFWSLQYCRASTLSLIRLELAMESGDRQRIIEAMDRLHALDGEIERKVADLPAPAAPDRAREALGAYLDREKMAVAFEKLVLASGISGPDVASPPASLRQRTERDRSSDSEPSLPHDVPTFPPPRRPGLIAAYVPKAAILFAIVAATAAGLAMAL